MSQTLSKVMLLGESDQIDFAPVVDFIREWTNAESMRAAADLAGVGRLVAAEGWHPDLVVVLQSWSDQFSEADVHDLIAQCPLARIVCCFGPWCDSDGRTRSIWPLAVRVPAAAAAGRLARELTLLETGSANRRSPLPLTASRAEIFEFDFGQSVARGAQSLAAVVISPDRPWREMIESAVQSFGLHVDDPQDTQRPDVVLFDADPWNAGQAGTLGGLRAANRQAQIVAAVGFPRRDFEAALLACGADRVWFKLSPLHELHEDLRRGEGGPKVCRPAGKE